MLLGCTRVPSWKNIPNLPLASNICDQMLREVERTKEFSVAHVLMNPGAASLLHAHVHMTEVYVITRGNGELAVDDKLLRVRAGNVVMIPPKSPHRFLNTGVTSLEHLVIAAPPFDPKDIILLQEEGRELSLEEVDLPPMEECFDGAKIVSYQFPLLDLSFAFGWVINDPERKKRPHYHKKTTEWIYVIEGGGYIYSGSSGGRTLSSGDWVRIDPGTPHSLRNHHDQHLVALCMCHPRFDMDDVHYL